MTDLAQEAKPLNENFCIHIKPAQAWWRLDIGGILSYRYLLWLLVRRDFVSKYRQTVLGPAWAIVQPVLMSLVFTVIFGRVAQIPTDGTPPFLFYMAGLLFWQYFAGLVQSAGNSLQANSSLIGKVYFPREVLPLSNCISQLIPFAIQVGIFTAFCVWFQWRAEQSVLHLSWRWLLLPAFLAQVMVLSLGVALFFSALSAKYRDFQHLLPFVVQVGMYLTPIIYPASSLERYGFLLNFNPIAAPIEGLKWALFDKSDFSLGIWGIAIGISLLLFWGGLLWFRRTARNFIDTA